MVNEDPSSYSGEARPPAPLGTGPSPVGLSSAEHRKLTVLSTLMAGRSEPEILEMALATIPLLAPCSNPRFLLAGKEWFPGRPGDEIAEQVSRLNLLGSPACLDQGNCYAIPVRSGGIALGYLLVETVCGLSDEQQFALQVLSAQLTLALDNARRHARERHMVAELAEVNAALEDKVERLGRILDMHERLTRVAARGGADDIVTTVAQLTGRAVALEVHDDVVPCHAGGWNLGWSRTPKARARLVERLRREPRPARDGRFVVALAGHRSDSSVLLQLADPEQTTGEFETLTLEYAVAVLAIELARSANLAETARRLRCDLAAELLRGVSPEVAESRAAALEVDLTLPRRVAVLRAHRSESGIPGVEEIDRLRQVIERVLSRLQEAALTVARPAEVVCLASADLDWPAVMKAVASELGHLCQAAVGSLCESVDSYPISLRRAYQAMTLIGRTGSSTNVVRFDDLGLHRLLVLNNSPEDLGSFVDEWLGPLLRYEAENRSGADLIGTLGSYFRSGTSIIGTASALQLHQSTVKYRLQRIADLTGRELSDPETRLAMQLAVYAIEVGGAGVQRRPAPKST